MSALAKPFISSATATNSTQLVPAEQVLSMDKLTIDAAGTTDDKFQIIFTCANPFAGVREIALKYADAATRDTAFTAIKTAICTAI